jgi:hypothetical protein
VSQPRSQTKHQQHRTQLSGWRLGMDAGPGSNANSSLVVARSIQAQKRCRPEINPSLSAGRQWSAVGFSRGFCREQKSIPLVDVSLNTDRHTRLGAAGLFVHARHRCTSVWVRYRGAERSAWREAFVRCGMCNRACVASGGRPPFANGQSAPESSSSGLLCLQAGGRTMSAVPGRIQRGYSREVSMQPPDW